MFGSDRPIQKSTQDRLGRTTFAKYLARCILDHNNPESLVIGLYGGWGTGKTSIINLMLEELNFAGSNMFDDEKPIILNFSPWSYSGQNQLIYAFFRRLSSTLRQAEYLKDSDKIIRLLELYVSFFTNKPIPHALRVKKSWFKKIFHPFITHDDAYAWESGRDLTQVKIELNELLAKQKHKIIVIIDNISRIESDEIRQIFQIVKSMGDYSNTVYLLAMDKEHVVNALGDDGIEYLEKVVQLPFGIPPIAKQDLENILIEKLEDVVSQVPEGSWNKEYWADLYYSTIKYFFENCRDITRYINILNFGFSRVKEVVNPVDYFAISAIRVFEPYVYNGIRDNKDLFTDLLDNVYQMDLKEIEEDTLRCDEIFNRSQQIPAEMLQLLLMQIFPRLRKIYQPGESFYHSDAIARKNKRICSPDLFDIYFRLSMPSGKIPDSEMDAILASTNNEEEFSQSLLRLNQDEKIIKFLDLLDGVAAMKIPSENIPNVIGALLNNGDLFPEGENTFISFNTPVRIHRILSQLLHRLHSTDERFSAYKIAIENASNSLYIIVHELIEQGKEHTETEDSYLPVEHREFTAEQLDALREITAEKITQSAESGRLEEHPKLLPLLYAWKDWGDSEACKQYVIELCKKDRGVVAFLCAALQKPIDDAISKLEKNPEWAESLKNIDAFIDPIVIEPHAKELFEDQYFEKLREREQLAILIFLDLIKAETIKIIPNTTA